jgi:hypothetical protein
LIFETDTCSKSALTEASVTSVKGLG